MDRITEFVREDRMIEHFAMGVEAAEEGFARVSAMVREEFLNSHRVAHGALVFAVIDVAFAIAVNATSDAVGVQWSFNIVRSARPGDEVTAECRLIHRGSRLKVVEYEVRNQHGALLAKGQATALPIGSEPASAPDQTAVTGGASANSEDGTATST